MRLPTHGILSIFALAVLIALPFSGCDCQDDVVTPQGNGEECLSSDDCPADQECVDGACAGGDPADADIPPDAQGGDDVDTDADSDDDVDVDPDCPNPNTCQGLGAQCGPIPDGCGGTIDCGYCDDGLLCGTGDNRGECIDPSEASPCEPLTCDDYPEVNCGQMSDGCGGLTDSCGECTAPEICGGGALPNVCGADPAEGCEGLCADQAICSANDPQDATTITGTVFAPNGSLPIPNAVVYVPNLDDLDDLPPIEPATECVTCEDEELGNPLVGTVSDWDGSFELRHVPAETEFPLVIKIGQWRRVVTIGPLSRCENHSLTAEQTRLPTRQHEGTIHDNIPQTAVSTGRVDAMECVFHLMGVEESEFTRHSQDGRIHLYRSNGGVPDTQLANACSGRCGNQSCIDHNPGSCGTGADGDLLRDNLANHLYDDQATLNSYDMVIMDCEGYDRSSYRTDAKLDRIKNYVDSGGRLFASHFAYDWLHDTDELQDTAIWGGGGFGSYTRANVDVSWPGGSRFWDWLVLNNANYDNNHQIEVYDPRGYAIDIDENLADRFVYTVGAQHNVNYDSVQQYTFDTPVYAPADEQCGQVAYSAFHVANVSIGGGPAFPSYCPSAMSPQEKVLAYMLFNLAACVTADDEPPPPECHPRTCADVGAECGLIADGCGDIVDCGDCPSPQICGADPDRPNECALPCEPLTCEEHGAECGEVDDGCGEIIDCGECPGDQVCDGNQCRCLELGESCESSSQCCSEQCGISGGEGQCVLG